MTVLPRLARNPVPVVQPSLRVGTPADPLEVEADAVADRVVRMASPHAAPALLQRCPGGCPGDEELRRQPTDDRDDEEEVLRRPARDGDPPVLDSGTAGAVTAARSGGQTLPGSVRGFFEPRFGADLSAVRVHADGRAAGLAAAVNARAFTVGHDVFFGAGEYRPGTRSGDHLLAHELTHTLQQASGPTVRRRVRANRVTCANARPGSRILNRIGTNDPVGVLADADRRAIQMLDTAIDTLTHGRNAVIGGATPAWPTIGDTTAVALRDRLGLDPSDPAVWTGTGARSVLTVIRRLEGSRRHLVSGWLRYQCLGSPSASTHADCGGPDCEPGDFASTCPPSNLVVLCPRFWTSTGGEQGLTLLHEALHVFFGFIGDTGQFGNAGCYDQLVADLHDLGDQGVC